MKPFSHPLQETSLIRQLKKQLFVTVGLLICLLIGDFCVGLAASSTQGWLGQQNVLIQENLDGVLRSMIDQETGLRGYLSTANPVFLEPFERGRPQYLSSMKGLKSLVRDGDFQNTNRALLKVEERANTWYFNFAIVRIRLLKSGNLTTPREGSTDTAGKALFDSFRQAVSQLQQQIDQDLAHLHAQINTLNRATAISISVLIAIVVFFLWRRILDFTRSLSFQLHALEETSRELGKGNLVARVESLTYSELNHLGEAFNTMAKALEQMDEVQRNFVSVVSHEFRTALTSIEGFSELMRDETFDEKEIKKFATYINTDARRLTRMITELLDLERMKSGHMTLHNELVDLNAVIRKVVGRTFLTPQHSLRLQLDETIPELMGDQDKLFQVMSNLLSNAVKYSPDGGEIFITSRAEGEVVHVGLRDHGMGIASDFLENVFERYSRAESRTTRHISGTGLGLPIVQQIVQMHGGTIWVESLLGEGSTFHFTLPVIGSREDAQQRGYLQKNMVA